MFYSKFWWNFTYIFITQNIDLFCKVKKNISTLLVDIIKNSTKKLKSFSFGHLAAEFLQNKCEELGRVCYVCNKL